MDTILIAQRDPSFSTALEGDLRSEGYRVISCPGPWPPRERCIRCDKGYCPLTEGADLMLYDPRLTALDAEGKRYNLAVDSALAHPDLPMLLVWPPDQAADLGTLRQIREQVPHVKIGAKTRVALLAQLRALLGT